MKRTTPVLRRYTFHCPRCGCLHAVELHVGRLVRGPACPRCRIPMKPLNDGGDDAV